jgi:hypothetical protein
MAVTHTWSIIRLEQLNDGTGTVTEVFIMFFLKMRFHAILREEFS